MFAGGGILLLVGTALPWFIVRSGGDVITIYAWSPGWRFLLFPVLLGTALAAYLLAQHVGGATLPRWGQLHTLGVSLADAAIGVFAAVSFNDSAWSWDVGFWVSGIGAALQFYGSWGLER